MTSWQVRKYSNLFFSQASERVGFPNPQIWLADHVLVTDPAFYDTAYGPDFFRAVHEFRSLKLAVIVNLLPVLHFNRRKVNAGLSGAVHFKMARKVTVSKFNWVFWSCESLLDCLWPWCCNGEKSCVSLAVKFELISVEFTSLIIAIFRRISVEYT